MVSEVNFEQIRSSFERFDTHKPLTPEQVSQVFPFMLRQIPQPEKPAESFSFEPQFGEHARFGVFFWAVPGLSLDDQRIFQQKGKLSLLIPTIDLFQKTGVNSELIQKGIVVEPSLFSHQLQESISQQRRKDKPEENPSTLKFNYAVTETVNKNYIVLDCRVTQARSLPPILSIPCDLYIEKGLLRISQ